MTIPRAINLICLLLCIIAFAFGYYVEYSLGIAPCSLCTLQRFAFAGVTLFVLIAAVHNPRYVGTVIYAIITLLFCLLGMLFAGRQIWLQHQPENLHAPCLPGLDYLIKTMPFHKAIQLAFNGSLECGRIDWTMFGFTMAEWSFALFLLFAVLMLVNIAYRRCPTTTKN